MISIATVDDLEELALLFDAYRIFYGKKSDKEAAIAFLKDRIEKQESIIFIASNNDQMAGFTQLYPVFSSTTMQKFYILNDLYVKQNHRNQGIGESLLIHAQSYVKSQGLKGLALETAIENPAQHLYEKLGWVKDQKFLHYFWEADV